MSNKRVLQLNKATPRENAAILYVMSRDQRTQDNHALLAAQAKAQESNSPLIVMFNLLPQTGHRSKAHYQFMLEGLKEIEASLHDVSIPFILTVGDANENIKKVISNHTIGSVYFDLNPLNGPRKLQKEIAQQHDCPVFVVDTHNIIPLWVLSEKEEYAAHTIRSKVHSHLEKWLSAPPSLKKQTANIDIPSVDWSEADKLVSSMDDIGQTIEYKSGEKAAHAALDDFISNRLREYADDRNTAVVDGQSNLSPYLHFGQISALRIALEVIDHSKKEPLLFKKGKLANYEGEPTLQDSVDAFLEELIVRKELADNYCFYNKNYTNLNGAKEWARNTLEEHKNDNREHIYSRSEWEQAETHDKAWNAAQKQMMKSGKMHGYMRMYWAKKILEWSKSPEDAIQTAIYLNDKYSLDGGDPNGYVGIMWSLAGVHDRPWNEREVFGKIRYMNHNSLKRRFSIDDYANTWL